MTRTLTTLTLLLASTQVVNATVTEWGGRTLGVDYTVSGVGGIDVEIIANGTFKFQAEDGSNNLDVIGSITINNSVTGTVTVFIERDSDDNSPGATDVGSINLTNTHATPVIGNLAELRITGDFNTMNASTVRNVTGAIVVPGDVTNNLTVTNDLSGTLTVGSITGNISVGHFLLGNIVADSADGDIAITSTANGDITIKSSYDGTITCTAGGSPDINIGDASGEDLEANGTIIFGGGGMGNSGTIDIAGDLDGTISFTGVADLRGTITIENDITSSGQILIADQLTPPGRIWVKNDVTGTGDPAIHILNGILVNNTQVVPAIQIDGTLGGVIAIDGELQNVNTAVSGAEILVAALGTGGAIAVNYDGAGSGEEWANDAAITVTAIDTWLGNEAPNSRFTPVWEVSNCIGDMNSDHEVNSADGSPSDPNDPNKPYALALDDATDNNDSFDYAAVYPGLGGSRDYHGNCNGRTAGTHAQFNADDNTAFLNLQAEGCCVEPLRPVTRCPGMWILTTTWISRTLPCCFRTST